MRHETLTNEQEALVALYALGSLDADEAGAFERHLTDDACDACRAQVDAMLGVCGDLALAPPAVEPSPAVRSRILRELSADTHPRASALEFVSASEGGWMELKPGVFRRRLTSPRPGDPSRSYLIRMEPGTVLDRHGHRGFEHCYVVAGSTIVGGRRMLAGDYSYAPRGSVHEAIPTDEGALLFIVETA